MTLDAQSAQPSAPPSAPAQSMRATGAQGVASEGVAGPQAACIAPHDPEIGAAVDSYAFVCALADIPVLGARVIERPGNAEGDVAVFRTAGDRVFAVLDRCPHRGGPLSQGIVYGERVACPLHNWSIELASGGAVAPDAGCTRTFPVRVERGDVFVAHARDGTVPCAGDAAVSSP